MPDPIVFSTNLRIASERNTVPPGLRDLVQCRVATLEQTVALAGQVAKAKPKNVGKRRTTAVTATPGEARRGCSSTSTSR
jgi:hypothetical protein